mmetsp:Transcript_32475/g.95897  ORF Transcript_32475/g.95897 Transcript_32475/m.95897 type:complete len:233 (-) Transcript_32475:443-1141(-)
MAGPRHRRRAQLAQEGAEGRDAGAGADHDDGRGRVGGQGEEGGADEDVRGRAGGQPLELGRADALLGARLCAAARLAQHLDGEVGAVRVGRRGGGDGVVARRQLWAQLEQRRPGGSGSGVWLAEEATPLRGGGRADAYSQGGEQNGSSRLLSAAFGSPRLLSANLDQGGEQDGKSSRSSATPRPSREMCAAYSSLPAGEARWRSLADDAPSEHASASISSSPFGAGARTSAW